MNLRLTRNGLTDSDRRKQAIYAEIMECVGSNRSDSSHVRVYTDDTCLTEDEKIYTLSNTTNFIIRKDSTEEEEALERGKAIKWLYQGSSFDPKLAIKSCIICNTNKMVDEYNRLIQEMNNEEEKVFLSDDKLADVDDHNGILQSMLTESVLNSKNHNSVPNHTLTLRVGDVCILMRKICQHYGLVNNARVQIKRFLKNAIVIETLDDNKREFCLPRIKFRFRFIIIIIIIIITITIIIIILNLIIFRLPYGASYHMLRIQFPLRLAFSYTIHKVKKTLTT